MTFQTADLSDAHHGAVQIATPVFKRYGKVRAFHGKVRTVKCFEDTAK